MMDDDLPFLCPIPKCGKRFTNEDHLNVHSKTHEMSLALNTEKSSNSPVHPFVDQTPTPTKILKNFEEIGLFQELSKNPFDDAYKKALDSEVSPLPGPQTNELNTPTLIMTDSTRHVSTTNYSPLAVERFKSSSDISNKLKPSPLAAQDLASSSSSSAFSSSVADRGGGKRKTRGGTGGLKNNSISTSSSSSSSLVNTHVTRSRHRDLTSQVADSTSSDVPLDMPSETTDLQEQEDFLGTTQSSPHSTITTTTNISTTATNKPPPPSATHVIVEKAREESVNGNIISSLASKVKMEDVDDEGVSAQQQQQCTMQVLLQLPNGQTVPISIPATINNSLVVEDKQQQQQQQQHQQIHQQPADVKPQMVTQVVVPPSQQHQKQQQQQQQQQQRQHRLTQPPTLKPAPSVTSGPISNAVNTTNILKQRLKAQLQNQFSPTAKSSSSDLMSAFVPAPPTAAAIAMATSMAPKSASPPQPVTQMFITQNPSSPLMMMMDSPGSEVNMSDSSEYSFDSKRQRMSPDCEDPEERRRKFLERNRAAAARCRQKRKHWIGNLERKADDLQSTNLRLQNDVKLLRGEVAHLKTLLLAHKECPVTQQQRSSGQLQQVFLTDNATAFSNQELVQVVPTGTTNNTSNNNSTSDHIQIMAFLSDRVARGGQKADNGKDGDE